MTTATLGAAMLSLASIPGTAAAEISRRAAQCSLRGADFNGDQCGDLVVGDPGASVAGKASAGRIHVVYGSEDGPGERGVLEQGQPGVGDSPEPGDGFGGVLRTTDIDRDGISDLVVGVPSESVGGAEDAGVIHVIFGSAKGLGGGRPGIVLRQGAFGIAGGPERGDGFGAAIAVNETVSAAPPTPALAFGSPGEDLDGRADAGSAGIVSFTPEGGEIAATATISQDSPGIGGGVEAGDRFGAAVGLFQGPGGFGCDVDGVNGYTLVVGAPDEDLDGRRDAGLVHLAKDLSSDTPLSQGSPGVDGEIEAGDRFGASLALTSQCEHDGPSHLKLAVGVPTEDIGTVADAGMVHLFSADDELPPSQQWSVSQNSTDVAGAAERGDQFGSVLAMGGPWRNGLGEPLVVGVPREDIDDAPDAGGVQIFGDATSTPGDGDVFLSQVDLGLTPENGDLFGAALLSRTKLLLVGAPDDVTHGKGAVHGIPWPGGDQGTPLLLVPGRDGIPADAVRFGAALG